MGRDPGGTKAMANAMKAKGLGRLRWYCQPCEKQMRDENGFQAHCRSEPHLRKLMAIGPTAGATIAEFSRQFQYDFVSLLKSRHNTQRVRANAVYNEFIQDKNHVHMNATRWVTLNGFIMTLSKAGIVRVDEDERGHLWIQWVDNRPETLAKQAAQQKKERSTMDGEDRERKMIEDQIARARAIAEQEEVEKKGLERKEGEKISLSLFPKPEAAEEKKEEASSDSSTTPAPTVEKKPTSFGSFGKMPAANPLKPANPLKRPAAGNVFKAAKVAKTDDKDDAKPKGFMSEAERLMKEDLARKTKGYAGAGPRRGDARR
ncbi:hypothetical protein CC85DRAFT_285329 [Cutaneotrichosporon oleaginosum]|uniref:C2H2-type domain-containing protein n=1 Tax=Cutaneotrichosporon oleaginosum TaxID=879819 RepID=A0A0J0XN88_9TREE|nr:uncharacterized protein CC85DRAFT_285329 [Cutaneotrichosporon oleaginosum]KLT42596.1 hypothetical protein CC85DRAFT_285329 [Cutaneotrichosporon oleaginosum]TXT05287.1 hypothetical protein COLE_06607 [Cutaneotrichosporon oleaginosum]